MELERLSNHYAIDVLLNINGQAGNSMIIPYILIPLVENSFSTLAKSGDHIPTLQIEVRIKDQVLWVSITSSKSSESSTLLGHKNINVQHIERRLELRYPGAYQLKKLIEPEKLELILELDLSARLGS